VHQVKLYKTFLNSKDKEAIKMKQKEENKLVQKDF